MNRLLFSISLAIVAVLPIVPLSAQHSEHKDHQPQPTDPIGAAVAAPNRTASNVARDKFRHPADTLRFFGVTPNQTVVEWSPGSGWYSEILVPLLREHGTYYSLLPSPRATENYKIFLATQPSAYNRVKLVTYPDGLADIAPDSVDTVLTFRNVHNMIMGGTETATFKAFYDMLKPGGILGIVDHRLPEDRDNALEKTSGYLKVSTVRRIAESAGFEFVGSSEINANPKDTADWTKGVWTLPPVLTNGAVDRDIYLAIGESDRMTLKFRKPQR